MYMYVYIYIFIGVSASPDRCASSSIARHSRLGQWLPPGGGRTRIILILMIGMAIVFRSMSIDS